MRGVPFAVVADGLLAAMREAEARHGLTSRLILCFLRHLDEADAFETFRAAEPYFDRIIGVGLRSEEHTSELQSLMRISYAVFCLKKKKTKNHTHTSTVTNVSYR